VQGIHQGFLVQVNGGPELIQPGFTLVCGGNEEVSTLKVKGVLKVFHGRVQSYKRNNLWQVQSA
jgi:hypothetical protein